VAREYRRTYATSESWPHRRRQDDDDRARPLFTGVNYKIGEVHEGAATMDYMVQEQERGSRSPPPDELLLGAARRPARGRSPPHQHHRHAGTSNSRSRSSASLRVLMARTRMCLADGLRLASSDGVGVRPNSPRPAQSRRARSLDLDREVDVARRSMMLMRWRTPACGLRAAPEAVRRGGGDREPRSCSGPCSPSSRRPRGPRDLVVDAVKEDRSVVVVLPASMWHDSDCCAYVLSSIRGHFTLLKLSNALSG